MIPIEGQPILTAAQMRLAEVASGHSTDALMARAGAAIAEQIRRLAMGSEVLIACGPGNNGGDGYVAAAILQDAGVAVRIAASAEPATEAARRARATWTGPVETLAAPPAPVLVDALFGTGLSRALDEVTAAALIRLSSGADLVIAVDLPSGVASDDGAVLTDAASAHLTLALGVVKPSHLLQPAASRCGTVRLVDIGVTAASDVMVLPRAGVSSPEPGSHKFSRGMVAVIAGTMPGAAALAASAAARVAGYVLLLGSATDRLPHAIVRRRWSADSIADPRIGAVVIGPGLGRDDTARAKLESALSSDKPLVIDGDALHLLDPQRMRERPAPTILTPHAGEFAQMFGRGQSSKIDRARAAAQGCGATIVFKGADTVVAHPDGRVRVAADHVGWLATAGSGDVLSGLCGGLLAHGCPAFAAASDAVWLHTESARRAGAGLIADDLIAALPMVIGACR